jgi:signal transduction histidine kinase
MIITFVTLQGNTSYHRTQYSIAQGYEKTWAKVFICVSDITELKMFENELIAYKDHLEEMVADRTHELQESRHREQKLLEVERKTRKELEEQIENRLLFTRALVHELKTPLMPMLGASEILSNELREEPYRSYATVMNKGICQLGKRVDELLDIARGEIGILKLQRSVFNPLDLLNDVVEFMRAESVLSGQKIVIELPHSMRPLWSDKDRLRQVLINIANNAFKFTSDKGTITLKAFETSEHVIFEIRDTGIGMDEKTKEKLFKPYEVAHEDNHLLGGLGLGLTLCKMIVELHSGKIEIKSKKNKGTCVTFTIPFELNNKDCLVHK